MQELTLPAPLLMLSGMGDDGTLLKPQREAFGSRLHAPAYIPHQDRETLADYAERWATTINAAVSGFDRDKPWFFGGVSAGGMIALDMLPHLHRKPAGIFLIASARSTPKLPLLARIGANASTKLSSKWVGRITRTFAVPFGFMDGQDDIGYRLLQRMAKQADPAFMQWAVQAVRHWTSPDLKQTLNHTPLFQAHGRKDWLIPLVEGEADLVIPTGKHLIQLSHPHTINRWLFDHITALTPGAADPHMPRVEDPMHTYSRRPEVAMRY